MILASQNPFRVERVHRLPYQLQGVTWNELLDRCANADYRGAIVGAHGAGKTTLLIELGRRLRAIGHQVTELFTNSEFGSHLPQEWRDADPDSIVLADGYDSPGTINRLWLRRRYPRLIVTSHAACALPTLYQCRTRPDVLAWIVGELSGESMDSETADALLHSHCGNMRDALRELYDKTQ
jgi:hypothetical protein